MLNPDTLFSKDNKIPVLALAPMEDITDYPFRQIYKNLGVDLLYTEFISSEALRRNKEASFVKMKFHESERPVGIQIFGSNPPAMSDAAKIAHNQQPDFIDINIGCPVKKIVKKGCGSALLKDLETLKLIARAVVKSVDVPVSVKTRIGWDSSCINILEVARILEGEGISFIAIHARTRNQLYGGKADWGWIHKVKELVSIPVIGNGDVVNISSAKRMFQETGCDGIMIGRAAMKYPWIFSKIKDDWNNDNAPDQPDEDYAAKVRLHVLQQLVDIASSELSEMSAVQSIRSHAAGYIKGFPGASTLRNEFVRIQSLSETGDLLSKLQDKLACI